MLVKSLKSRVSLLPHNVVLLSTAIVLSALLTPVAHAQQSRDFTYGGDARAYAMGGAGLALNQTRSIRVNPAMLAFDRRDMEPTFPALGIRTTNGIGIDSAGGFLVNGMKNGDSLALTREFSKEDSQFGLNGAVGFRVRNFEISTNVVAAGRLQPNDSLKAWSLNTPGEYEQLPKDVRGDVITSGYYNLPAFAYGMRVPTSKGKNSFGPVGVGVRMKYMTGFYSHYVSDYDSILGLKDSPVASEMNGQDRLTKTGFGMDFGVMAFPNKAKGVSLAFVAANLINPRFTFDGTDRNGNPTRVDLVKTTYSAGVAYERKGTALALDFSDMTGATGPMQVRVGAEQRVWGNIFVRGGYSTSTGPTVGFSLFGVDAAYSKRLPLEVVKTISF
jgi:hypothetical protein